jgi:ParB-like nuclease domain
MKVHPAADIFPMLSDEELQDLDADIRENGLIHPIVTHADGEVLIDGRSRLAACKIARVEPTLEMWTKVPGHELSADYVNKCGDVMRAFASLWNKKQKDEERQRRGGEGFAKSKVLMHKEADDEETRT